MAYEAVKGLITQFPEAFRANGPRRPLKVGIYLDLLALGVDRRAADIALRSYVRSYRYLIAMTEGAVRVDPFGQPAGVVTAQDAADAKRRFIEKFMSNEYKPEPEPAAKASAPGRGAGARL